MQPKTSQVLSLSTFLALILGFGAAYAREQMDQVFRTPKEVEKALDDYYRMAGWSPDGIPTQQTLEKLDIAWAI